MYANFFVKLFHIIYYRDSIRFARFRANILTPKLPSYEPRLVYDPIYLHDPIIGIYPDKKKKERKENKESISDCIGRSLMK